MGQCVAKSKRTQAQCRNWAIQTRSTCRMHGGKGRGPKTKAGKERSRLAVLKQGRYTKKAQDQHREAMEYIRECKEIIRSMS